MKDEPVLLVRDPETPSELRDLLEAGRTELPDEARLGALAAKLGLVGAGVGAGAGAASSGSAGTSASAMGSATAVASTKVAATSLAVKALVALAVATGVVAGGYALSRGSAEHTAPSPPSESPALGASTPSVAGDAAGVLAPDDAPREQDAALDPLPGPPTPSERSSGRAGKAPANPSAPLVEAPPEVPLVRAAQDALVQRRYGDALRDAERHRVAHPRGALAQEREVIAIEALVGLGRRDEAQRRADRFRSEHPTSPHVRRIETVLGSGQR